MSEEPSKELSEEEHAVMVEVANSGDKGVYPEEIAKKLNMPAEKVVEILENFEKDGWFYSEEDEEWLKALLPNQFYRCFSTAACIFKILSGVLKPNL